MNYLIIGAGPAGLAAAVTLHKAQIPFEIVDAGDKVGGIWDIERAETPMYRSAHFISSRPLSGFADFPMPDHYPDYPSHALVQEYIEDFARHHQLGDKARFQTKVLDMQPEGKHWRVRLDDGTEKTYRGVICATGITWHPNLPQFKGEFVGEFIHSFHYKDPEQFRGKRVLVIGGGNSGCDIACDAAREAEKAFISLRRGYYFLPKYIFGMPSDQFKAKFALPNRYLDTQVSQFLLNKVLVGKLENYGLPRPDHNLMESHPIMNSRLLHYLGHGDIQAKKNVAEFRGKTVVFEDGSEEELDLIVAATGYRRSFPFLKAELLGNGTEEKEIEPYLQIFSRQFSNLFFVGGIEVSSAIFGLLSLQGDVIAAYLQARHQANGAFRRFLEEKQHKQVNLRGGRKYIDSLRHQRYVDRKRYQKILHQQLKALRA